MTDTEDPNITTLRRELEWLGKRYPQWAAQGGHVTRAAEALSALASTLAERDKRIAALEARVNEYDRALAAARATPPAPAPGRLHCRECNYHPRGPIHCSSCGANFSMTREPPPALPPEPVEPSDEDIAALRCTLAAHYPYYREEYERAKRDMKTLDQLLGYRAVWSELTRAKAELATLRAQQRARRVPTREAIASLIDGADLTVEGTLRAVDAVLRLFAEALPADPDFELEPVR